MTIKSPVLGRAILVKGRRVVGKWGEAQGRIHRKGREVGRNLDKRVACPRDQVEWAPAKRERYRK